VAIADGQLDTRVDAGDDADLEELPRRSTG